MKNGLKVGLAIAAGVFATYAVAAPYITVYEIKSAAEARDGEALSEYIEFPSVRQSIKDQLNAQFAKEMANDPGMKGNPFAFLGAALAGTMVDKAVDAYITPAGISQLLEGEKPNPGSGGSAQPTAGASGAERKPLPNASMSYESFDKFVVNFKLDGGSDGKLILRRRGIGWKLVDIILP